MDTCDLFDFYMVGDNMKELLRSIGKLKLKTKKTGLDEFWWTMRGVLNDYNSFIKTLELEQSSLTDSDSSGH
jgi:hypothetical protein